jgi:hypothetical protein
VHGRFSRSGAAGAERWNAALKFGAPVGAEPVREGLWLYGELPRLDVDAWQAVFAAPRGADASGATPPGIELRGVDLKLGRARYLGREFAQVTAQLARSGSEWAGKLESPLVAGDVRWNWEGKGRLRRSSRASRSSSPRPRRAAPRRSAAIRTCPRSTSSPSASSSRASGWGASTSRPSPTATSGASTSSTS